MLKLSDVLLIGLVVAVAATTFRIKHKAEYQFERNAELQADIEAERETINILNADWSLLSRPARLQALTEHYGEELGLEPLRADQVRNTEHISNLQRRPSGQIETLLEDIDGGAVGGSGQ